MQHDWPTKDKDLQIASKIIEEYIDTTDSSTLGLFELVINGHKETADFRLSGWVIAMAEYFQDKYGTVQGEFVTKMVVSRCLIYDNTVH